MRGRQSVGESGAEGRSAIDARANARAFAWTYTFEGPWRRCGHDYPIRVVATEGGARRAQCLGCKGLGPEGIDTEHARQRLLAAAHTLSPLEAGDGTTLSPSEKRILHLEKGK